MTDGPDNEWLLHICRAQNETLDNSICQAVAASSANNRYGTLTRREIEVLTLFENGESTSQIATLMDISSPTVRNHIPHILDKMQVHNGLDAVMLGKRLNLIP